MSIIQTAWSETPTSFTEALQGEIRSLPTKLKSNISEGNSNWTVYSFNQPEHSERTDQRKSYRSSSVSLQPTRFKKREKKKKRVPAHLLLSAPVKSENSPWSWMIRRTMSESVGWWKEQKAVTYSSFFQPQLPLWIPALKDITMDLERSHRIYSGNHNLHYDPLMPAIQRHSGVTERSPTGETSHVRR